MSIKKQVYEIDDAGYIVEIYVKKFDEETPLEPLAENIITVSPPNGLYRARWTGADWIEDMTQEEIDALNNVMQEPTDIEVLQKENLLLKAQVQANSDISDFHEELIVELAMMLY